MTETTEMTETTLEVRLIRHGEKYPSNYPDAALANQLTEEGSRAARAYGASLAEFGEVVIVTSSEDRAIMTGREIGEGYFQARSDGVLVIQEPISALTQRMCESLRLQYRRGKISRADAVEGAYVMVRPNAQGDTNEIRAVTDGAQQYISVAIQYIEGNRSGAQQKRSAVVLVGHDPNIGCVEQLLEPRADLKEVIPLDGITFVKTQEGVHYQFTNNALSYQGVLKQ